MAEIVVGRFETPDERREFENGSFELVHVGAFTVGRARYDPGWKWSEPVGDEPYVSLHFLGAEGYATE